MTRSSGKRVCIGEFGAPHGVRGLITLRPFAEQPEELISGPSLETDDGRPVRLSLHGTKKGALLVAVDGVSTREGAAALSRIRLYVHREDLPATDDDEWYHADLIGLGARDMDGHELGRVIAVPDFGAGPLLEVQQRTGSSVYVPFTRPFVPTVDVAGGYVAIDPPPGLFAPESGENSDGEP